MATHERKIWPEYFEALEDGRKPFEVRIDDQIDSSFEVGDKIVLKEWDPNAKQYTGRWLERMISYVLDLGDTRFGNVTVVLGFGVVPGTRAWLRIDRKGVAYSVAYPGMKGEWIEVDEALRIVREHNERKASEEQTPALCMCTPSLKCLPCCDKDANKPIPYIPSECHGEFTGPGFDPTGEGSAYQPEADQADVQKIYVEPEDMKFLNDLLEAPPQDLPWIRKVPKRLFLDWPTDPHDPPSLPGSGPQIREAVQAIQAAAKPPRRGAPNLPTIEEAIKERKDFDKAEISRALQNPWMQQTLTELGWVRAGSIHQEALRQRDVAYRERDTERDENAKLRARTLELEQAYESLLADLQKILSTTEKASA